MFINLGNNNNRPYLKELLCGLNELIYIKGLEWCLAHGKHLELLINIIITITIYLINPLDCKLPESKGHVFLDSVDTRPTVVPDT